IALRQRNHHQIRQWGTCVTALNIKLKRHELPPTGVAAKNASSITLASSFSFGPTGGRLDAAS
ncbi:MAG TPA: hypothetical protein VNH83_06790, partial [Bryobacteraceae bacterium]|nr:hypothetical protein [Bryobacteraceae bacterium]